MDKDPIKEIAMNVLASLRNYEATDVRDILTGVSTVLATLAVEAGMEEEKAVYAFRKSFRNADSRLKQLQKEAH